MQDEPQRENRLVRDSCEKCVEPTLEPLCESAAWPALMVKKRIAICAIN